MFIRLEPSSGVPVMRQIADQIRAHCASGSLKPGDNLPSVRELSQLLAINQNTVHRVYERLTAEGFLERRHGDGTYVADHLPNGQMRAQKEVLNQLLEQAARRAQTLNINAEALHRMLDDAIKEARKPQPFKVGE